MAAPYEHPVCSASHEHPTLADLDTLWNHLLPRCAAAFRLAPEAIRFGIEHVSPLANLRACEDIRAGFER
jgi:hypothetical protein